MTTGVVLLAALAVACGDDEPKTAVEAFDEGGEARVELVTGEPFEATAVVDEVLAANAFVLYDTLVVTATPADVAVDDRVRVTGEVAAADEVERDRGERLSDEVRDALADEEVVVVADGVEVVGRDVR
jgi:hypothetical protein